MTRNEQPRAHAGGVGVEAAVSGHDSSPRFVERVRDAILEGEAHGPVTPPDVATQLSGYSGCKLIGVLQRLARLFEEDEHLCYAEIGVFRGFTLLSVAAAAPRLKCYGIDNFSQFDPNNENFDYVRKNILELELRNAILQNLDFESALERFAELSGSRKIALLFVDGPHDYRSQMVSILLAKGWLNNEAVIVVDDTNYNHVRQANRDFLASHPRFKLIFEAYTDRHPMRQSKAGRRESDAGWWNGVNVIVTDPEDQIEPLLPSVLADRRLFLNEHTVHAHRYGLLAPEALEIFVAMRSVWRIPLALARLIRTYLTFDGAQRSESETLNTFSRGLPRRLASFRKPGS